MTIVKRPVACAALIWILAGLLAGCSQPGTPSEAGPDNAAPVVDRGPETPDPATAAIDYPTMDNATDSQGTPQSPAGSPPPAGGEPVSPDTLAAGYNRFGFGLYARLRERPGNLFFSPHSIATALTMTYAGARGKTAEQMARTLQLPAGNVHGAARSLSAQLAPTTDVYELSIANRLWAQQGLAISDRFRDVTSRYYDAEIALLDFAGATESARQMINRWVSDQTRQKIPDLLAPNAIGAVTRLVLTNAIYFKGTWVRQFDAAQTAPAPFHGAAAPVPMMLQQAQFGYAESDAWQALRLPYLGNALSMVVLLPRQRGALAAVEAQLDWDRVAALMAQTRPANVTVWLPRFSASSQFTLNDTLRELGIDDAFVPSQADFSGITGSGGLYITKAIHKAFVEVNEEGSEAAAATAVVMGIESEPRTIEFRADHPFVFMIVDERTSAVLFLGRLVNPE